MTPATFGVDFKQLMELLVVIVALAFFVERAVSLVVEHRWYKPLDGKGFKAVLAFVTSLLIVWQADLDFVAIMFHQDASPRGQILTAMVIAGGSKAAIKFMKDVVGIRSGLPKPGKK